MASAAEIFESDLPAQLGVLDQMVKCRSDTADGGATCWIATYSGG